MIATQYSLALFQLAVENHTLDKTKESFDIFIETLRKEPDFLKVMLSPRLKKHEKRALLKKVYASLDDDFIHFLFAVIDNNQMGEIQKIYVRFNERIKEHRNIETFDVYSARELNQTELKTLIKELEKRFSGHTIEINNILDAGLLGGVRIVHNGQTVDVTLKHQMKQLKASI